MSHQTRYIYDTGTGEVKLVIEAVPVNITEWQIVAALAGGGWWTLDEWGSLSLAAHPLPMSIQRQINGKYSLRAITWEQVVTEYEYAEQRARRY